ncbi:ferritin-like domain-containing protein [Trinickia dinghuensis]|nr:ferritin-like domain-containing protein [Trinickia dinghuensis]
MESIESSHGTVTVKRNPAHKETDIAALRAIAQAALEVELFTIPLYMTSLYSIYGMHAITGKNLDFYKGRLWPGAKPVRTPANNEEQAFNILFSVFIDEMLHLQLASNMATAVSDPNSPPKYSTCSLVDPETHAWKCFGHGKTRIPNIIDLAHTQSYQERREQGLAADVDVGALNEEKLWLFCAIERDDADARADVLEPYRAEYFPTAPFDDIWKPGGARGPWEAGEPLPQFGSIGWMYQCYSKYVNVVYEDGSTLWDSVFNPNGQQNDLFNNFSGSGHPMREFMGFETTIALTYKDIAKAQMLNMMSAITDQGEGSTIKERVRVRVEKGVTALSDHLGGEIGARNYENLQEVFKDALGVEILPEDAFPVLAELTAQPHGLLQGGDRKQQLLQRAREVGLQAVKKEYRPSPVALESDYPSFNDSGVLVPSADAAARTDHDEADHFERFNRDIRNLFAQGGVRTWTDWWAKRSKEGCGWQGNDLKKPDYVRPADDPIPSPDEVAEALNTLRAEPARYYPTLSQAAVGSIAGVLTVLDDFWNAAAQAQNPVQFPFPSMVGSGDRMAICWAVFGKAPDLSIGLEPLNSKTLYHACQGLDLSAAQAPNDCAQVGVFHSCRGSNQCNAQGGCGFVQKVSGGGNCSTSTSASTALQTRTFGNGCNPLPVFSAPGDNRCQGFGGCAVPISASQRFPVGGTMQLFDYKKTGGFQPRWQAVPLEGTDATIAFEKGERIDKIAYEAYKRVLQARQQEVPPELPANPLRIAMPPST